MPDARTRPNEGGHQPSLVARLCVLVALLVVVACAESAPSAGSDVASATAVPTTDQPLVSVPPSTAAQLSPLAALVVSAGTLPSLPEVRTAPAPVAVSIDRVGIDAGIVAVGVKPSGELEVPPADLVGWYRFGARPGDAGSAVLAAHIAYDGADGAFRRLSSVKVGTGVVVAFDDGSERRFVVTRTDRYDKDELPSDLFARTGPARLALVTCGGAFNRDLRSYEDNVVVIAELA
ncbi:MAG: class F sortase [Acidimicrobiales bacterium]